MADSNSPADNNPLVSSDKRYYASRNSVSALGDANRYAPSRRGRPGSPLVMRQPPANSMKGTSADKYYTSHDPNDPKVAHQVVQVPDHTETRARPAPGKAYAPGTQESLAGLVRPLIVLEDKDVAGSVGHIVALLGGGQAGVRVQVGSAMLEQKVRTGLELRVAREQITETQYRDVRFSLAPKDNSELADQMFGKIDVMKLPVADADEPLPLDFGAFVRGTVDASDAPASTGPVGTLSQAIDQSPTVAAESVSVTDMEEGHVNNTARPVTPGSDTNVNFGTEAPFNDDQD